MTYDVSVQTRQRNMEKSIEQAVRYADAFVSKNYLIDLEQCAVKKLNEEEKRFSGLNLIEITKICYDPQENVQEKLKTVYTALYNAGSSILLLIKSTEMGIRYYLGIKDEKQPVLSRGILEKSLKGNFPGIDFNIVYADETEQVMTESFPEKYDAKSIASVSIVPGKREQTDGFVQGIEKFIDTMAGEDFTALFIADPVDKNTLEIRKRGFEKLYTSLSVFSGQTLAYGENTSQAVNESLSAGFSDTINESVSDTVGKNTSEAVSKSRGTSQGRGSALWGMSFNSGTSRGKTKTSSYGENESHAQSTGTSHTDTKTDTRGTTDTAGSSVTLTTQQQNKTIQEILEKIDDQLLRIRQSESFGLFDVACYFSSSDKRTTLTAANTFKALVAGEHSNVENSFVNVWSDDRYDWDSSTSRVCDHLRYGKQIRMEYRKILTDHLGEEEAVEQIVTPANLVNGMELPMILDLPMKSVNGVSVVTSAEFGRNVRYRNGNADRPDARYADLGTVYHMGTVWPKNRVKIDIDSLASHCFITGTTGSGKSNATYKLLDELVKQDIRFLVIEPAKGEYKSHFGSLPGVNIFTTNHQYYEMLHLNPFEFPKRIHVAEHLDKLIQVFSACWPLYAAMPAILKDAFEKAYKKCGWDIHRSIHFQNGNGRFPTFQTVLDVLPEIIHSSAYSSDTKGDYIGSLVTRVRSLTTGLVGDIFSMEQSIDNTVLFEQNTILDLSRLQSDETVSLIMGVMIMKLNEFRMTQNIPHNSSLRHVTVLEEAHNILKRVSTDQDQEKSNVQGASVGMIRKSVAEMRTYGEGFIIIDQSPAEVDPAAIRNTNTKLILKLSDKEDFETVGRTIGLNDDQIPEIGRLPRGVAVAYQTEWEQPVLTMLDLCGEDYVCGEHRANDQEAEKEMLGLLLSELLVQHDMKEYNMAWTNSILNTEKRISEMKRRAYREQLMEFKRDIQLLEGKKTDMRFARLVYELAQCGDLFEIFELKLPMVTRKSDVTTQMRMTTERWLHTVKQNLDKYFRMEDSERDVLMKYLLFYETFLTDKYQYKIALNILYPQGWNG